MLQQNQDRILKLLALSALILLFSAILIAYLNPATGFEISIYEGTGSLCWLFITAAMVSGIIIIIVEVATKSYARNRNWVIGVAVLILGRLTLLLLPFIHGYQSWQGDQMTQIGESAFIVQFGNILPGDLYPISHVLVSTLSVIGGASVIDIGNRFVGFFSVFYVFSLYLLSKTLLGRDGQLLTIAAIGGVILSGYDILFMPNGWSILFLPFISLIFFKSAKKEWKILLIILLVLCPFFHPLTALVLLILLIFSWWLMRIWSTGSKRRIDLEGLGNGKTIATDIFLLFGIFFVWISSHLIFYSNTRLLYLALTRGAASDYLAYLGTALSKSGIEGLGFISLIIRMYGAQLVFLILALVAAIMMMRNKKVRINWQLMCLISVTFISGGIYLLYLSGIIPGLYALQGDRFLTYATIFTPVFAGLVLSHFLHSKSKLHRLRSLFIIFLLIASSVISINSIYPSEDIFQPNLQATKMDLDGYGWILEAGGQNISLSSIISSPSRYSDLILGINVSGSPQRKFGLMPPDHFGYNQSRDIGDSYFGEAYLVINRIDRIVYDTYWKSVGRFNNNDFAELENDLTAQKIFCNGETSIWHIR